MNTRPFSQHIDALQLEEYAAQLADVQTEATIEAHLLECDECRAMLAEMAARGRIAQLAPDRLETIWSEVASRIDQPPTSVGHPVPRAARSLWNSLLRLLAFTTSTRPLQWVRWAAVPVALTATVLVIMNVAGTTAPSQQQSAATPSTDSSVGGSPHGLVVPVTAGVAAEELSPTLPGTVVSGPDQSGSAAAPGLESAPPMFEVGQFRPGDYVAAFLPAVPDGNDVDVSDGLIMAGDQAAAPDALAEAEARRHVVMTGGLPAMLMVVEPGKYVVFSGPYDTEQQAQAACALSVSTERCVPAQPIRKKESLTRGLPRVV